MSKRRPGVNKYRVEGQELIRRGGVSGHRDYAYYASFFYGKYTYDMVYSVKENTMIGFVFTETGDDGVVRKYYAEDLKGNTMGYCNSKIEATQVLIASRRF